MTIPGAKKKILVIEDEPDIQILVTHRLSAMGYETLVASDGQAGLTMARKEVPDLILLDLMLPKIDGFKVCRMLKFDKTCENIPIIVFSSRCSEADRKLVEQVGANAFLAKPFEWETFTALIKKFVLS
ncbi:MAG TPA: response regulator [Candidatus Omnitrophota bacterium]|nr:response regulator [Candidatus Omnitrophota bacterium]